MAEKSLAGEALKQFKAHYVVPDRIVCDGSKEQTGKHTEFQNQCRKHHIDVHVTAHRNNFVVARLHGPHIVPTG